MPEVLSAAILIGGAARRLDRRFKPLLTVGDQPILARQLEALARAGVEHIALVGRWSVEDPPPRAVFADAIDDAGALGALYSALLIATTDRTVVLAGDMPFVTPALLSKLTALRAEDEATVPCTAEGLHPLCACYRRSAALRLKSRLDRRALSVRAALDDLRVREIGATELASIDPDGTMLMNVNTPADYQRACAIARDCA